MLRRILVCQSLMAFLAASMLSLLNSIYQPTHAETPNFVIEISVDAQTLYSDLITQAESLVSDAINRQFGQDPNLPISQIVVMGDRNGEIIPILTTTVSRAQWQENPQVNAWTKYYGASYALLQRYRQEEQVAMAPVSSTARSSLERSFQIDEAFDSGRLTGQAAQSYLSDLD